jgi:hypothetical protein
MQPIQSWSISIVTAPPQPPAPGGPTFQFQVQVRLQNSQQGVLRVETVEELMAICAVLQIPTGQLFFEPNGQMLIKSA